MFYTYVLLSKKDKEMYVGYTANLRKRIEEHNKGRVPVTNLRRPLTLIYYEACLKKEKAIAREKYFKTGFGRKFLKNRL
jgi:putative endonuclease